MFRQVADFTKNYRENAEGNIKLLEGLTDAGLSHRCTQGHRSAGEVAWHIVQTMPEMLEKFMQLDKSVLSQPVPDKVATIIEAYRDMSSAVLTEAEKLSDADLLIEDNMYGETWQRGYTLLCLYAHEVHHFGQLTVLMRAANLPVFGRFGPSKEEWAQYGMEQPAGLA